MPICRRSPGAFPARPSLRFGMSARVLLAGMHVVQGSICPVRMIPRCRADSLKIGSDRWPARSWNTLISTRLRSLPTWKGFFPWPKMASAHSSLSLSCIIRSKMSHSTAYASGFSPKCSGVDTSMPYLNHTDWGGIKQSQAQAPTPWGKPSQRSKVVRGCFN